MGNLDRRETINTVTQYWFQSFIKSIILYKFFTGLNKSYILSLMPLISGQPFKLRRSSLSNTRLYLP